MIVTLDHFPDKYLATHISAVNAIVSKLPAHQYIFIITKNDLHDQFQSSKIIEGSHMYKYQLLTDHLFRNASVVIFVSASNTCQVLKQNFLC
jgi:hypothetical protein